MNKALAIAYLQPDLTNGVDYEVRVRDGIQEVEWHVQGRPKPTVAELEAAWPDALRAIKKAEMRTAFSSECREDLGDPFEAFGELNTNPGGVPATRFRTRLVKLKELYRHIDDRRRTAPELEAVTWNRPSG